MSQGQDSLAAGRGRQRLKLAAISYVNTRHGIDADADLVRAGVKHLCKTAIEYVRTLPGDLLQNRQVDLHQHGDAETLKLAAIAYANARHGSDADLGMTREGLVLLCQAAIDYTGTLPLTDSRRPTKASLQLGNGTR